MPSPTDFNLSPYFDDTTEDKKFHRVLFRPAFAVQARELTQSQTILQNLKPRSQMARTHLPGNDYGRQNKYRRKHEDSTTLQPDLRR